MSMFKHFVSRPALLKKLSFQVFVLINASSLIKSLGGKTTIQAASSSVAYGNGIYGQGACPSYPLYFSFVSKGGN